MSLLAQAPPPLKKSAAAAKKKVASAAAGADDAFDFDENSHPNIVGAPKETSYVKLTQLEHILLRPDTYIGSIEAQSQNLWVYDAGVGMSHRPVTFVPGLYKIFDEILVNAADNKQRDPTMDTLKVVIDAEKNTVSVMNNGSGISIKLHPTENIYNPELIFGHLLTSSNYDDTQKKVTGGRNGYGAKLTNIFSTRFVVETADGKKRYKQVFTNNMNSKKEPVIEPCTDNWTKITFSPDLRRFKMSELDADIVALMSKRVYDVAGCNPTLKVYLNGVRLNIKSFKDYCNMYLNSSSHEGGAVQGIFETVNDRWEVAFAVSDSGFQQVSFVNSICTTRGGTHVNNVTDQIVTRLIAQVQKKSKNKSTIKPAKVKQHLWVFVRCLIENAAFDSQTKETLTTRATSFGSKCELSEAFFKTILSKTNVLDSIMDVFRNDQSKELSKTDGKKMGRITGMPKLEDANDAGTRYGKHCTLILTEGDSAKTFAVSGLGVVGRDRYGVFPLRGKLINPRDANHESIMKNEEIKALKTIIGLQQGMKYRDTDSLRYGHIMIMTDQDPDGSHIKGLLINLFHYYWPELLKIPGFLMEFVTPIVKVSKGKQTHTFFTLQEYHTWKEGANDGKGWTIKYYKGLGTSSATEAKSYFSDLNRHELIFDWSGEENGNHIDLAFSKKRAEDRKEWLSRYDEDEFIDHSAQSITYSDFVNKELIHFSMLDNKRSIPSAIDGLKPGQRKILFCCFKRKLKGEIKVAQLTGYVSEHSAYHHGEASLSGTIVGLAQNFTGSNNINFLYPSGQFGTRLQGGKDSASPRYIFTRLCPITRMIFREHDDALLKYLNDDGQSIEPQWYLPILPTVLVNGSDGIGTGWSSTVPTYNPRDIVDNIRRRMEGDAMVPMQPWFRGFKGVISSNGAKGFKAEGIFRKINDTTIEISELPPKTWTQSYKEFLDSLMEGDKAIVKSFKEFHTDTTVRFEVTMDAATLQSIEDGDGIEKKFKLSTKIATTNLVLFDQQGQLKKYNNAEEIIEDFFGLRLEYYGRRKDQMIAVIRHDLSILENRVRFINCVLSGELVVNNRKKAELVTQLQKMGFASIKLARKSVTVSEFDDHQQTETEKAEEEEATGGTVHFDYLLGMPIWSLTAERVRDLRADRDAKNEELGTLLKKSPEDLWNSDLEEFLVELDSFEEEIASYENDVPVVKKGGAQKKRPAKKIADSESDLGDSDSEDFVPTKKKAPAAKKIQANKPAVVAVAKSAPVPSVKAVKVTAPARKEVEEPDEMPLAQRLLNRAGGSSLLPTVSSAAAVSDDEGETALKKRSKPSAKPVPKKKRRVSDSGDDVSDDDTEDYEPMPVKRAAPKAKKVVEGEAVKVKKSAPKKKVRSDSDEDEVIVSVSKGPALKAASPAAEEWVAAKPRRAAAVAARETVAKVVVCSDSDFGGVSESEDGEFFVSPPAAKAAPTVIVPVAKPKVAAVAKKVDAAPKSKAKKADSDDDMEFDEAPKKKAAAPKPKAKKADSDDDMDFDGAPKKKTAAPKPKATAPKPKAAPVAKRPAIKDSDSETESFPRSNTAVRAARAKAPTKYTFDSDSDISPMECSDSEFEM